LLTFAKNCLVIEYPSILNSSKAPRQPCIAFEKYDGSNIRVKYTQKRGFCLFGSRTQLIDESHPHLGEAIHLFNKNFREKLTKIIKQEFPNEREVIAFFEFYGDTSFAGIHNFPDVFHLTMFDVLVGHKNRKFIHPRDFVKLFKDVQIARVIYEGNLTDQFINDIREGKYALNEGVVCKGTITTGAARGGVWMAKIKTQSYLDKLLNRFGKEGLQKYGE
jgi:hypothetical protein